MFSLKINDLNITIYGTSHNKVMGVIIDGLPAKFIIDEELLKSNLKRRKALHMYNTSRNETDDYKIISGYTNGMCDGTPLNIQVVNENVKPKDYDLNIMRPSHSDYSSYLRNNGVVLSGGGAFSGRLTILLVIAGTITEQILRKRYERLNIATHIKEYNQIVDSDITDPESVKNGFPFVDKSLETDFLNQIKTDFNAGKFFATRLNTVIQSCPVGLGDLYFDSFESTLSKLLFSIPAIKSVSFGEIEKQLSESLIEELYLDADTVKSKGVNGGVCGGITFDDVKFSTIIKPVSSNITAKTVMVGDVIEDAVYESKGRHDLMIANRICVVIESVTYMAIYSLIKEDLWKY